MELITFILLPPIPPPPIFVNGFDLLKMDIVRSKSIYTPEPTLPLLSLVSGIKGLFLIHLMYSSQLTYDPWEGLWLQWLKFKMSKLIILKIHI